MNITNKVTLQTLKKNKTRTIVTIIGVILSAAMITAVTTFISSMQAMLLNFEINTQGSWQATISDVPFEKTDLIVKNDKVKQSGLQTTIGYGLLDGSQNTAKPYVYVRAFDKASMEMNAVHLVKGRLPENPTEIVLSETIASNGGVNLTVGDTVNWNLGSRVDAQGQPLDIKSAYNEVGEKLINQQPHTYTIVGIIERPTYMVEPFVASGYSVFTCLEPSALSAQQPVTVTLIAHSAKDLTDQTNQMAKAVGISTKNVELHGDLLDYMGYSDNDAYNRVLYSMGAILIVLIMVGSISLIYNAFAISISERSKQFGMMAGIGATSAQIRNSVLFEAGFIGIIGIPLGIGAGIGGIGVTLYLLRDVFATFFRGTTELALSVSVPAVVSAAVIGFLTILLSAWLPARRAAKVSPMEAIRQTNDVKIRSKQVKTSRLSKKLFGIEGDIALKNFKRNRKRYRATVFSLFISIVLFVSASSFSSYMEKGTVSAYADINYDIAITFSNHDQKCEEEQEKLIREVASMDGVKHSGVVRSCEGRVFVDKSIVRRELLEGETPAVQTDSDGKANLNYTVFAVGETEFERYIQTLGLSLDDYTDTSHPLGIAVDMQRYYDSDFKLTAKNLFTSKPQELLDFQNVPASDEENPQVVKAPVSIGTIASKTPVGVDAFVYSSNSFSLIVSDKVYDALFGNMPKKSINPTVLCLETDKTEALADNIGTAVKKYTKVSASVYDLNKAMRSTRNVLLVINVFSYGFITLITLITVANVFNTISTNVNLRRREFAMLKSVGMTSGGFNRMINFECIFYGLKSLLYGIPVSIGITYLICRSVTQGIALAFNIPWLNIFISVIGVFLIVFITMMYSMSKVRKENIVDALKNENL